MKTLILLSIFLMGCTWSKGDIIREVTWQTLHAVDYGQTRYAMKRPTEFKELNPLLGDHPSEGRLNLFTLVTGIGHILITDYAGKYRSLFQNITIGFKVVCVANNFYVRAKIKW